MVTYKIPYSCLNLEVILSYIEQYNSVLKCTYNYRLQYFDNSELKDKEVDILVREYQNQLNHVELIFSEVKIFFYRDVMIKFLKKSLNLKDYLHYIV